MKDLSKYCLFFCMLITLSYSTQAISNGSTRVFQPAAGTTAKIYRCYGDVQIGSTYNAQWGDCGATSYIKCNTGDLPVGFNSWQYSSFDWSCLCYKNQFRCYLTCARVSTSANNCKWENR